MKMFTLFSMVSLATIASASPQGYIQSIKATCPLAQAGNPAQCYGQVSNCWNPGTADIDCDNNELCCFNGCVNVCTAPVSAEPLQSQCKVVKEIRQENKIENVCNTEHGEKCEDITTHVTSEVPSNCKKECKTHTEVLPQRVAKQQCKLVPEKKCTTTQMETCTMANQTVQVPKTERDCSTSVETRCQTRQQDQCHVVAEERCQASDSIFKRSFEERQCGNPIEKVNCQIVNKQKCFDFQDEKIETRTRKSCKTFQKEECQLQTKEACFDTTSVVCSPVTATVSFPYKDTVCKFLPKKICQKHDVEICDEKPSVNSYHWNQPSKSKCRVAQVETCHDSETEVEKHCKVNRKVKTDTVSENKCRETRGLPKCSPTNEATCETVPVEKCIDEEYEVIIPYQRTKCGDYQFNDCKLETYEPPCTGVEMTSDYIETGQSCGQFDKEICAPVDYEYCTEIPHELCNSKVVYVQEAVMKQICSLMPSEQCNVVNQERCETVFETIEQKVNSEVCKDVCHDSIKTTSPVTKRECNFVPQQKCEQVVTPMTFEVDVVKCDW